jgi:DnaA N-terminal domain/Helix-turn-helix domain
MTCEAVSAIIDKSLKPRLAKSICKDVSLSAATRLVGWLIADMINMEHGFAWPAQELMAKKLGLAVRTVQRAVADLEAAGHLIVRKDGRSFRYYPGKLKGDNLSGVENNGRHFRYGQQTKATSTGDKKAPLSILDPSISLAPQPRAEVKIGLTPDRCTNGDEYWSLVKRGLAAEFGDDVAGAWFDKLAFEAVTGGAVRLRAPSKFVKTYIEGHFAQSLTRHWSELQPVREVIIDVEGSIQPRGAA